MPDIREILQAIDEKSQQLWSRHRTEMRRAYIVAHNATMGAASWTAEDDALLDLIDIKLALLFDRSGHFEAAKDVIGKADGEKIEANILNSKLTGTAQKLAVVGWDK
jgi:hypothetical protein